jgi:hypothetical protein
VIKRLPPLSPAKLAHHKVITQQICISEDDLPGQAPAPANSASKQCFLSHKFNSKGPLAAFNAPPEKTEYLPSLQKQELELE